MNRKGIELPANFLVIIIISFVVFGAGLAMIKGFFSQAEQIRKDLDQDTVNRIEQLMNDGSRVSIPVNTKKISRGDLDVFGLGVNNVLPGSNNMFNVSIEFKKAVYENGSQINKADNSYINTNWIYNETETYEIDTNEYEIIGLQVKANPKISPSESTYPGTYIFDVDVSHQGKFYDGHIHKIYVVVP
ncbi:MAG: hypothetical protein ACLFP2_06030 [Candidatus Woesearchaeota archaeon]